MHIIILNTLCSNVNVVYYVIFLKLVTPVIQSKIMDQALNRGDTASFACQATGQPVPTISWYFSGTLVDEANTMKYTISMMSLNTTTIRNVLTIMNVQSSDVGTYTCNATNVVSSDISSGVLTVNGKLLLCMATFEYFINHSCPYYHNTNGRTTV